MKLRTRIGILTLVGASLAGVGMMIGMPVVECVLQRRRVSACKENVREIGELLNRSAANLRRMPLAFEELAVLFKGDGDPLDMGLFVCPSCVSMPGNPTNITDWTDYVYIRTRLGAPDLPAAFPMVVCPPESMGGNTGVVCCRDGRIYCLPALAVRRLLTGPIVAPLERDGHGAQYRISEWLHNSKVIVVEAFDPATRTLESDQLNQTLMCFSHSDAATDYQPILYPIGDGRGEWIVPHPQDGQLVRAVVDLDYVIPRHVSLSLDMPFHWHTASLRHCLSNDTARVSPVLEISLCSIDLPPSTGVFFVEGLLNVRKQELKTGRSSSGRLYVHHWSWSTQEVGKGSLGP